MKANKLIYLVFLILIAFVYTIVFKNLIYSNLHSSDLITHIRFAQKLLSYSLEHKLYFIPHPLFHLLLITFYLISGSWELSAIVLLLIIIVSIYNLQILFISKEHKTGFFNIESIIFSFILMIVSSIYIPPLNNWLSPDYFSVMFSGSGTPNVLHNPTYYLVKVFVLPVFFVSKKILGNILIISRKTLIIFITLLSVSVLAKPNFALSFIPSFAIILIWDAFHKSIKPGLLFKKLLLFFSVPVIILFLQFFVMYMAGPRDSSIRFCFFCVWTHWSKIPVISILLGIVFPLFMFLLNFARNVKNISYQFAWLNFIISLLFAGFLYEDGYRLLAGNLFWGYNLSLYLLFFVSLMDFIELLRTKELRIFYFKIVCATIVLLLHIAGGIYHFSLYMH
jgi:hypothetical protein